MFINDMVTDRKGRAYVGDCGMINQKEIMESTPGRIMLVDPTGKTEPRAVVESILFPNGMSFNKEQTKLYVVSTIL